MVQTYTRGGRNRTLNPSAEVSANFVAASASVVRVNSQARYGAWSMQITFPAAVSSPYAAGPSVDMAGLATTGATHRFTGKMWIYSVAPQPNLRPYLRINYSDATRFDMGATFTHPGGGWYEYTFAPFMSDPAKTITTVGFLLQYTGFPAANVVVFVDGLDCRIDEPDCDNYIDGDQFNCTWTGTAHASASTRLAFQISYVMPTLVAPKRGGRNAIINPSFETNVTGWTARAGCTVVQSNDVAWFGSYSLKVVCDNKVTTQGVYITGGSISYPANFALTGVTHRAYAKVRLWIPTGMTVPIVQIQVNYTDASFSINPINNVVGTSQWQELSFSPVITDPAKTIQSFFMQIYASSIAPAPWMCYIDGVDWRFDEPDCDDYIDGSPSNIYAWTGTAHASASTRIALVAIPFRYDTAVRGGRNRATNPSFEVNTTGWAISGAGSTLTRDALQVSVGAWAGLAAFSTSSAPIAYTNIDLTGVTLTGVVNVFKATVRFWIALSQSLSRFDLLVMYTDATYVNTTVSNVVGTGDWQTLTTPLFATDPAKTISYAQLRIIRDGTVPLNLWIDALDVRVNEPNIDQYIDGSIGTGYAWVGTAHASASTRSSIQPPHAVGSSSRGGRNRIRNPSVETNTSWNGAQGGIVLSQTDEIAWVGTKSMKAVVQAAVNTITYQTTDLTTITTTGEPHLLHGRVRFWAANGVRVGRFLFRVSYSVAPPTDVIIDGLVGNEDWQDVLFAPIVTDSARTISAVYLYHYIATLVNVDAPYVIYLDGFDVRIDEPDIDDYIDGSLGTRYAWAGTAHSSMSTRLGKPVPEARDPFAINTAKNWAGNPSVELSPSTSIGLQGNARQAMSADASIFGSKSLKVVTHPTTQYSGPYFMGIMTGITGGQHTVRSRVHILLGIGVKHPGITLQVGYSVASGSGYSSVVTPVTGTGEWQTVDMELVTTAGKDIASVSVICNMRTIPACIVFFLDACDIRVDQKLDGYFDGSLGPRYSWTGTAHASPSLRAAVVVALPKLPKTGPITLTGELWKCDVGGGLIEDISSEVLSGAITWSADRSDPGSSGGTQMTADFVVRHPERLLPYIDFITPFLNVDYGNGDSIRQRLGIYLTDIPNMDIYPTEAQAQIRGKDLTWVMANSVPTGGYHALVGYDFSVYLRQIALASGLTLTNIRDSDRVLGYTRSFTPGMSYLEMFNKLAGGIGWYPAFMDMAGNIVSLPYRIFTDNTPVETITTGQVVNLVKSTPETTGIGNVCVVMKDNGAKAPLVVIRKNQDPRSAISIPNIGREIMIGGAPIRNSDLESLGDAKALAKYKIQLGASYTNTLDLEILPDPRQGTYRTVELDLGDHWADLAGRYWVKSWSIGFTPADGPTKLTVARVVNVSDALDEET